MRTLIAPKTGLLAAGCLGFGLLGIAQSVYGPSLPALMRAFGLSQTAVGVILSAHWFGAILGVVAMFRIGHRLQAWVPVALMAVGQSVIAAAPLWPLVLLGATLFGVGGGVATVIFNRRVLTAFGPRGPAMVGLINALYGIGAIAGPLLFVALGSVPARVFALAALCGAVLSVFVLVTVDAEAPLAAATAAPGGGDRAFRIAPGILLLGAVAVSMESCLIGLGPAALVATGVTETHAATLLSAFFVAFLSARLSLLWLAARIPAFAMLIAAFLAIAVCGLSAAGISAPVFFVLSGLATGLFFPSYFVTATARMGTAPAVAPTIITAGMIGGIGAPLLMGLATAASASPGTTFFLCIAAAAALAATAATLADLAARRAIRP
jgi:MFS transporter, FHS family, glucose/mannose:H+ symporter